MLKQKDYRRTETHEALHPDSALRLCGCGVRFKPREDFGQDDPDLCLDCNRRSWSVLFGATPAVPVVGGADVLPMREVARRR